MSKFLVLLYHSGWEDSKILEDGKVLKVVNLGANKTKQPIPSPSKLPNKASRASGVVTPQEEHRRAEREDLDMLWLSASQAVLSALWERNHPPNPLVMTAVFSAIFRPDNHFHVAPLIFIYYFILFKFYFLLSPSSISLYSASLAELQFFVVVCIFFAWWDFYRKDFIISQDILVVYYFVCICSQPIWFLLETTVAPLGGHKCRSLS